MSEPRGIEERIEWFQTHNPSGSGMCAQHTWHALGGNNGNPPAWGAEDANACVDKVKASGRYWTPQTWDGPPPRGAWVGWKYGNNGHAALSNGDGKISTTDPSGNQGMCGIEPLDYPKKWGFDDSNGDYTVWTDQYNGVRFPVGVVMEPGEVYLSKLVYATEDSDSVKRLQQVLNDHPLSGGEPLPITGNYYDETDEEVRLCQQQHGFGNDAAGHSSVGPSQAEHLFAGTGNTVIDDISTDSGSPGPTPPKPPVSETKTFPLGIEYHYSNKPAGTFTFSGSYKKLDVASWGPKKDGLTLGMLYANVDGSGEFRSRLIREDFNGSGEDPTAYQTHYPKSGDNYLLTHVWFESGEANRKLHYELCTMDGETMNVGTRYAKFVTIPWEVVVVVTEALAVYSAVRTPVVKVLNWLKAS